MTESERKPVPQGGEVMTNKPIKESEWLPEGASLPIKPLIDKIKEATEDLKDIRSHFQDEWRYNADSPGQVQQHRLKDAGRHLNEVDKIERTLSEAREFIEQASRPLAVTITHTLDTEFLHVYKLIPSDMDEVGITIELGDYYVMKITKESEPNER